MQLVELREYATMEFDALVRKHGEVSESLEGPRKIPSYEVLFDGINLPESLQDSPSFLIPIQYLHGTQLPEEYDSRKRKQVERHLAAEGMAYLLRHPVVSCMLTDPIGATLAIYDGHHRMRYAPEYGIYLIPTIVTDAVDLVDILRSTGKADFSTEVFTDHLRESVDETLTAFDNRMPSYKRPRIIERVTNIGQLNEIFRQF